MRSLLDEHVDRVVAEQLRRRGHDVTAVTEEARLVGASDRELLEHAVAQRRAVVTYDIDDFRVAIAERAVDGRPHFGVVFLSPRRFPQGKRHVGALITALDAFLSEHADDDTQDREWWP